MDESGSEGLHLRGALAVMGVVLVVMLGLTGYAWLVLPAGVQIATHWNIRGEVDGYGSKAMGLLLSPVLLVVVSGIVWGAARLDPRRRHVVQSQVFLRVTLIGLALFMLVIHGALVGVALGLAVPMNLLVLNLVGGLFIVMGNYLGKVRSNFFAGVRTPWTLSSELSWNKTHRLAGRLFVASGLLTVALAWVIDALAVYAMLVSLTLTTLVSVVYSYLVWKQDPARQR